MSKFENSHTCIYFGLAWEVLGGGWKHKDEISQSLYAILGHSQDLFLHPKA